MLSAPVIIFIGVVILIFLILISKIKVNVYFFQNDFKYFYLVKIKFLFITLFEIDKIKASKKRREKSKKKTSIKPSLDLIKEVLEFVNLEKLELNACVGFKNEIFTSIIIPYISSIITLSGIKFKVKSKNFNYKIVPLYNKLTLQNNFKCIFSMKIVHIISIIVSYYLERRIRKNGTSNRRIDEYGYEKFKGNGGCKNCCW